MTRRHLGPSARPWPLGAAGASESGCTSAASSVRMPSSAAALCRSSTYFAEGAQPQSASCECVRHSAPAPAQLPQRSAEK